MSILDAFRLDGKVALVTGCRRGIGKGLAEGLAEAGADIVGVSASMEESGSDIERSVTAFGRRFTGYSADLNDRDALYDFIRKVKSDFPVSRYTRQQRRTYAPCTRRRAFRRVLGHGHERQPERAFHPQP